MILPLHHHVTFSRVLSLSDLRDIGGCARLDMLVLIPQADVDVAGGHCAQDPVSTRLGWSHRETNIECSSLPTHQKT